jgi:hypothetical protein
MDSLSDGPLMAEEYIRTREILETRDRCMSFVQYSAISTDGCDVDQVSIDVLPDNVLLDIFEFYIQEARRYSPDHKGSEAWKTLVSSPDSRTPTG